MKYYTNDKRIIMRRDEIGNVRILSFATWTYVAYFRYAVTTRYPTMSEWHEISPAEVLAIIDETKREQDQKYSKARKNLAAEIASSEMNAD